MRGHRCIVRSLIVIALTLSSALAHAQSWPAEDWQVELAAPSEAIEALQRYAFPERDDESRKGIRTDALLIVRDGVVVYEHYATPITAQTPHLLWSMSKSVLATLMGVAYGQGKLRLDDPVANYYAPFTSHPQVKVGHLLNWASGLDWQEGYEYAPLKSSVVAMLYTRGRSDMAAYVSETEAAVTPGTQFRYSSGDSNVLAAALKNMVGAEAYADYPWSDLFEPLGIQSAVWERDASGTFVASSYAYMNARDLARIGLLMQRDGRWQDEQLVPKAWVDFNRTPFANYLAPTNKPTQAVPGGHWWLNVASNGADKPWPDAPSDTFAALGHWGQGMYVMPSQNLVIVRYADDRDGSFDQNRLLGLVQNAFSAQVQP